MSGRTFGPSAADRTQQAAAAGERLLNDGFCSSHREPVRDCKMCNPEPFLRADLRLARQAIDCTYGDTPGLVHCALDAPCATHRQERLRADLARVRSHVARAVDQLPVDKVDEVWINLCDAMAILDGVR